MVEHMSRFHRAGLVISTFNKSKMMAGSFIPIAESSAVLELPPVHSARTICMFLERLFSTAVMESCPFMMEDKASVSGMVEGTSPREMEGVACLGRKSSGLSPSFLLGSTLLIGGCLALGGDFGGSTLGTGLGGSRSGFC